MLGIHDSHALGLVGYAKVKTDGTSPKCNSGIRTRKVTTGIYEIVFPQDLDPDRTIVHIQPYVQQGNSGGISTTYVLGTGNSGPDSKTIQVEMFTFTNEQQAYVLYDYAFDITVFRTIVPNEPSDPT